MSVALKTAPQEDVLTYPISINYGKKDWNVVSALREFISNMLDTQKKYQIHYENGFAIISDDGDGLPKKSFIFGESTRDDSQIGQFGEGAKMAFITLLRENRHVSVQTKDFDVQVQALDSKEYGTRVMQLVFYPNGKKSGTEIRVECSKDELDQAKSLFLDLDRPTRLDENIYSPGGSIYVLGLKTTQMPNLLFSYDLQDKSMTNRDRNIVDSKRLQDNLVLLLKNAKNQKLIQQYLQGYLENSAAYEYQFSFYPNSNRIDAWKKALSKLYSKACLSSDFQSDLLAHTMGYQVLRNVPSNLLSLLQMLGLKSSSVFAKQYNGESILDKNRLIFPISESYVSDWTRIDAIREFLANALDAGNPRVSHNGMEGRISDGGQGILKKHFVLGVSGKSKQTTAIGKFGEGLKMACLILARTGSVVKIESVGTTYFAKLEYNSDFETKLLVVEFQKNNRTKGSSIVFDCRAEEMDEAKMRFLQFRGVRKKPVVDESNQIFVYPNGNGTIYVNGLETTKVNGIFDYNITDKTLLNSRDRNGVDTHLLQKKVGNFLIHTQDESIIQEMLVAWKKNKEAFEYSMTISPTKMTIWAKFVKKLYPKAAFDSGYYDENDFIAKQAGYELLSSPPYFLRYVFERSGISSSEKVAKNFRNRGILFGEKIVYPITKNYASDWNVEKALRELIANAIDADPKCKISKDEKNPSLQIISDKGDGISASNFLFGNSNKTSSDGKIGMFGEGLKIAALVFARLNRTFYVVTQGMIYTATLERDRQFDAEVLVVRLSSSRKKKGTDIYVQASPSEMSSSLSKFLVFNSKFQQLENEVYVSETGRNAIFINGVWIQNINSLFSYNFKDKTLSNRDRNHLDMNRIHSKLRFLWASVTHKKMIEAYLKNTDGEKLELQFSFALSSSAKTVWAPIVKKLYHKQCFSTGTDHDGVARDKGFKLIPSFLPLNLVRILRSCNVPSSTDVAVLRGDEKIVKKHASEDDLSALGKRRWKKTLKYFSVLHGVRAAKKIQIVEEFHTQPNDGITLGMYEAKTDNIYIWKRLIEDETFGMNVLLGTLLHEQVHRLTGEADRTRAFEEGLTNELGRVALMLKV